MTMRGSRAISSFSVRVDGGDHRVGLALRCGSVAKSAEVGSTSGEKTKSLAVAGSGLRRSQRLFGRFVRPRDRPTAAMSASSCIGGQALVS